MVEQNQHKIMFKTINLFWIKVYTSPIVPFLYFPQHNQSVICVFFTINMHINSVLIKAQESPPKAFKIGKTPELSGGRAPGSSGVLLIKAGPWTPPTMAHALAELLHVGLGSLWQHLLFWQVLFQKWRATVKKILAKVLVRECSWEQ